MADKADSDKGSASEKAVDSSAPSAPTAAEKSKARRSIPGDFSYTPTYGKLRTALENMVKAERPDVFNKDYVGSYLGVSGGSATPIPPILKRMGFLGADNRPTDLYAKFQNDNQRPAAALEGLKRAFGELFKRHTFAHTLTEDQIKNILVEITGLKKSDAIVAQIYGTFDALRHFVPANFSGGSDAPDQQGSDKGQVRMDDTGPPIVGTATGSFGLSYHINIVLPETKDISVFNAIFQSLKANLLT